MKILITGTSGRIGSAIADFLSNSHEVIGIDTKIGPHTNLLLDVREKEKIFECVQGVDAIIHCAALLSFHIGVREDKEFREINIKGTENLLEASQKYGVKRFVYTSTTSIYGDAMVHPQRAVWVTEELLPQPRDIYDQTKMAAETLCKKSSEKGVSCISLRMSRCFPEQEDLMAIYRLYRGVHIQDVVKAHELALHSSIQGYEVLNISCQSPFQQSDIDQLNGHADSVILRYYPWAEKEFSKRGWSLPKIIDRVYVIEKAKNLLGYQPSHNFSESFKNQRPKFGGSL